MKNLLPIILVLIIQTHLHGQSLSGKIQLGGTASFFVDQTEQDYSINSILVQDEYKTRTIAIAPQIGYFVNENISVGGRIGYTNEKIIQRASSSIDALIIDNKVITNLFNVGPFVRFHKPVSDQFYLFLQGNVELGFGTNKNGAEEPTVDENVFRFEAGLRPGLLILFSEKFGVEGSFGFLGYTLRQTKVKDINIDPAPTNKDQDFGLRLGLATFSIGLQFYL